MKLAEALILRADCKKRIAQLKSRLLVNAKVQEGDAPAETPQELIAELDRVSTELLNLIKRINRTNSATAFAGRGTISDALAERDVLALQRAAYAELAQTAAISHGRFTRSEIKYVSTINVAEIQKRADELAKNYRDLDARIQELNWQTELVKDFKFEISDLIDAVGSRREIEASTHPPTGKVGLLASVKRMVMIGAE